MQNAEWRRRISFFGKAANESGIFNRNESVLGKMVAVDAALLAKFTDLAFDESAEMRWQEAQPGEADNVDVGPVTVDDMQRDMFQDRECPF